MAFSEIPDIDTSGIAPASPLEHRLILKNCGITNPRSITDYIDVGGYEALHKALRMTPSEVTNEVKRSGLRGRGLDSDTVASVWEKSTGSGMCSRFVICDAAGSEPYAPVNRAIINNAPHAVIEAIILTGY